MSLPTSGAVTTPNATQRAWIGYFRVMRRYHRYSIHGLEHLLTREPLLIVGYHGRPIAHDLCMLTTAIHEHLHYLPHPIFHDAFGAQQWPRDRLRDLGFFTGDGPELEAALKLRGAYSCDAGRHARRVSRLSPSLRG